MPRSLPLALCQLPPRPATAPLSGFAAELEPLLLRAPHARLAVFPELHLCGTADPSTATAKELRDIAEPLTGRRIVELAQLAGDLRIWLLPGTVCERGPDGELFNTAPVFSPEGRLVASYRKVFPWRPGEPYDPGDRFVVFDIPGTGRVGLAICYDAWFPEVARHLAWMGAEVIVNPVMTTTADRPLEHVLARANAIVNQVFVVSVNTAGPVGTGGSLVVDPEGHVRKEAPSAASAVLTDTLDLDDVTRVRTHGTFGVTRMWDHFTHTDRPIELPLYEGRIDPARWQGETEGPSVAVADFGNVSKDRLRAQGSDQPPHIGDPP